MALVSCQYRLKLRATKVSISSDHLLKISGDITSDEVTSVSGDLSPTSVQPSTDSFLRKKVNSFELSKCSTKDLTILNFHS